MKAMVQAGALLLTTFALSACAQGDSSGDGFANWKLSGNPGAVEMEVSTDGLLHVEYGLPDKQAFTVTPSAPITLPDDAVSVSLWYARHVGDFSLIFQIRDADGVLHEMPANTSRMPHGGPVGWVRDRAHEWSMWYQAESYRLIPTADVSERTLPEYLPEVEALVWPRPLTLEGIVIKPAASAGYDAFGVAAIQQGEGDLWLANLKIEQNDNFEADWAWSFNGRIRWGRDEAPVVFLDDLTTSEGEIRYEVELTRGYQGSVIWRQEGVVIVDREEPDQLFRERIVLPELPQGRYFLNSKTWKANATFDEERLFLGLYVLHNYNDVALSICETPSLAWSTSVPNHVFPVGSSQVGLNLSMAPEYISALPEGAEVQVSIVDYNDEEVFAQTYPLAESITVTLAAQPGMECFALGRVYDGGRLLDQAHLHFGVESAPEPSAVGPVPAEVPDRDTVLDGHVHTNAEYWVGDRPSHTFPWVNDNEPEGFELFLQQAVRAGAKSVSIGDMWGNHEMLPGVYQWHELDRRIELASQYGLKVFLAYTADGSQGRQFYYPLWLDAVPQQDQSGMPHPILYRASWWDAKTRDGYLNYYGRLVEHVRQNPNVIGYRLSNGGLFGKNAGWGVDPYRINYSLPTQQAFERWITSGEAPHGEAFELGAIFTIPGTMEKDLPGYDLSWDYQGYVDFNAYSLRSRLEDFFAVIRERDPVRQIQVDQKPYPYAIETSIPLLQDGGVLKNEDSPTPKVAVLRSMCVQAGVPYVEELHNHMPTSRSIADATNFWSSYLSRGIFWLMRWHSNMVLDEEPDVPVGTYTQKTGAWMLDYMRDSMPAWEEWIQAWEPEPEVLVFGSRAEKLLGDWRSGGDFEIGGVDTFLALLSAHQVPTHFADEYADWVDLDGFNVVFVCGEVMAWDAMQRIADYAQAGGKVVLVGNAGYYCSDRPAERGVLDQMLADVPAHVIRRIAEPQKRGTTAVPAWQASYSFPDAEIDAILAWAGVSRKVSVEAAPDDTIYVGFECQLREGDEPGTVYVAVMRKWLGSYHANIDYESHLEDKYGRAGGTVYVYGLNDGSWQVDKLHRDSKTMGTVESAGGQLVFELDETLAGEVQIFRLTKLSEPGNYE